MKFCSEIIAQINCTLEKSLIFADGYALVDCIPTEHGQTGGKQKQIFMVAKRLRLQGLNDKYPPFILFKDLISL